MQYDVEQLKILLENLELDISEVSESERELRNFFNLKSSSVDYYVLHADIIDSLLKCCVKPFELEVEVSSKNFDTVYNLLKNDLYKLKSKEIKSNNIDFDQVDQLEFFNFLNKLYNDPDFVERVLKYDESRDQVQSIQKNLECVLRHQVKKHFKNTSFDEKYLQEFGFQSKQELLDEAYRRLVDLDISSCLKNIYFKDALFTIADDVRALFSILRSDACSKEASIFKKFFNIDFQSHQNREFLTKLGAIFAGAGTLSIASIPILGPGVLALFGVMIAQNTVLTAFLDSSQKNTQKNDALNAQDVINQKYAQLEDEAYYNAAVQIRYNNELFNELKELKNADLGELKFVFESCTSIEKIFTNLERTLKALREQRQVEIQTNESLSVPYAMTRQLRDEFNEIAVHFQSFSREDRNKLLRLVETSKDKTQRLQKLVKTAQLFKKDLSTIKTFEQLMSRLASNSEQKQNNAQEFLAKVLTEAENLTGSQSASQKVVKAF